MTFDGPQVSVTVRQFLAILCILASLLRTVPTIAFGDNNYYCFLVAAETIPQERLKRRRRVQTGRAKRDVRGKRKETATTVRDKGVVSIFSRVLFIFRLLLAVVVEKKTRRAHRVIQNDNTVHRVGVFMSLCYFY